MRRTSGDSAGGYLAGRLLNPLAHERIEHIVIAIACLLVSILAIAPQIIAAIIVVLR